MTQVSYGKDLARYKLERAREELDTAILLFDNDRFKAANNRAYYSIYYSLTAILCLEPIAFKKHKDTIGYFNKNKTFCKGMAAPRSKHAPLYR